MNRSAPDHRARTTPDRSGSLNAVSSDAAAREWLRTARPAGIDPYERNLLNRERPGTLIEELEFLARVVNDSALSKQIDVLRGAALPCRRSPLNSAEFVIEGP
jgi:hypothetical protein